MTEKELEKLLDKIRNQRCETQTLEIKAARDGCPEKLYDTLSSFSNQSDPGVIVFGVDEQAGYELAGVYDAQDLQTRVMEQAEQMTPPVRPVFTICKLEGKVFVAAEIPPLDVADRPCFKTAKGRLKGAYTRVGSVDKPMTEYEVYSYEAYRKKIQDDLRPVEGIMMDDLNTSLVEQYITLRKVNRPNLSTLDDGKVFRLTGIKNNEGALTMMSLLLFGIYPQARFPQLCILATYQIGDTVAAPVGERFADSKRIEGTLQEMLDGALYFVRSNMRTSIRFNEDTAEREDVPQYPVLAVREALLNALIHRDYSRHTDSMPICLRMYRDKLVITNPGGLYGRITVDQLGHAQPDTRNPQLVAAMEALGRTENRYSGIPSIREAVKKAGLPEPVFESSQGEFRFTLSSVPVATSTGETSMSDEMEQSLLAYCAQPRTRQEIASYLGINSVGYAVKRYITPLVAAGRLRLTIPAIPRSPRQRYVAVQG